MRARIQEVFSHPAILKTGKLKLKEGRVSYNHSGLGLGQDGPSQCSSDPQLTSQSPSESSLQVTGSIGH